jgi:ParB-like chromosome segregation protein Spo0J
MSETLNVEWRNVEALVPYARNARTHSDEQVAQIAASIKEFGWTNPVLVDGDNGIIAGHGRVMAARKLGLSDVPCIELSHLTDAQRRAYILADNKLAENADWSNDLLQIELSALHDEGFDLGLTGFSGEELSTLMYDPQFEPGTADDQGQLDQKAFKMVTCPHCEAEFDASDQV